MTWCSFRREEVPELYQKYYLSYNEVMESLIDSTVKNLAVTLSLDEFRLDRKNVERKLRQKLEYIFQGIEIILVAHGIYVCT